MDANTLVSGIVFSGPEHEFLKKGIRKELELVTSEDVIEEIVEVMNRKFPEKAFFLKEFLKLANIKIIKRNAYEKSIEKQRARDVEDRHVLAAALASGCDAVVTEDKDLLVLRKYKRLSIKTTKELLRK